MRGTILNGERSRYQVSHEVGRGGVGVVYQVKELAAGIVCAAKLLHADRFPLTDAQKERFRQEIVHTLALESDFVVRGIDRGEFRGEPFLVMEWMRGGTLQKYIADNDYGIEDTARVMARLLKALRDLRAAEIVHRDIKPNNALLSAFPAAKLGDLGVARAADESHLTLAGDQIGSLLYISERQRRNPTAATYRDDFYATCLVMYEVGARRRIHTRNPKLEFLKPERVPLGMSRLIDLGMEDRDDWEDIFGEMSKVLNLEWEIPASGYMGSRYLPEVVVSQELLRAESALAELGASNSDSGNEDLLKQVVTAVTFAFEATAKRIWPTGVVVEIGESVEDESLALGASFEAHFAGQLTELDMTHRLIEDLLGNITFDVGDDGVQVSELWGNGYSVDESYLPIDFRERVVRLPNTEDARFLEQLGQGLAIGVALGAIERLVEVATLKLEQRREEPESKDNASNQNALEEG